MTCESVIAELEAKDCIAPDDFEIAKVLRGMKRKVGREKQERVHWSAAVAAISGNMLTNVAKACTASATSTIPFGRDNFLYWMTSDIVATRKAVHEIAMYLETSIPRPYVQLLSIMVNTFIVVGCIGLVPKLHWVAPAVSALVTLFFYGFYVLAIHMTDPFHEKSGFGFDTDALSSACDRACQLVASGVRVSSAPDAFGSKTE
eukprot:g452.t1